MRQRSRIVSSLGLVGFLGLLLLPGVAQAADPQPTLRLQAPVQATLEEMVTLKAVLLDPNGSPVAGVPIQFLTPASFLSVSGDVLLGEATTNEAGLAVLRYEPRRSEEVTIIARFAGNFAYGPVEATSTMAVEGAAQLYQEEAGIRVPGVNVSLLALILGGVWSIYFFVFVLVSRIAREGAQVRPGQGVAG